MIENLQNEIWYDIPGYEYYQLSTLDRLKSLERQVRAGFGSYRTIKAKILAPTLCKGYLQFGLYRNGQLKTFGLHHLKAMLFLPNPNNYKYVLHKDNNPLNNSLDNLKWGTCKNNIQEAWRDGLHENTRQASKMKISGENAPWHKLTKVEVLEIRNRYATNQYTQKELGQLFNVSDAMVCRIVNNKNWNN